MQQEILYGFNSLLITAVLFGLIIAVNEIGFAIGKRIRAASDNDLKSLTGSVQASILGLLALLLGFTFSMALQRYDDRSEALIAEANAIGTAILRVELLPEQYREVARKTLADYIDLRSEAGQLALSDIAGRQQQAARSNAIQQGIWAIGVAAAQDDPRPVTTGAFLAALNQMIDAQGRRNALLGMHVPEVVLILLFVVFIAASGILGYTAGLSGRRIVAPTILVSFLISLVVFIIIDLDRPRRGLIKVDQTPLLELRGERPR